jgi:hypothetical protein
VGDWEEDGARGDEEGKGVGEEEEEGEWGDEEVNGVEEEEEAERGDEEGSHTWSSASMTGMSCSAREGGFVLKQRIEPEEAECDLRSSHQMASTDAATDAPVFSVGDILMG